MQLTQDSSRHPGGSYESQHESALSNTRYDPKMKKEVRNSGFFSHTWGHAMFAKFLHTATSLWLGDWPAQACLTSSTVGLGYKRGRGKNVVGRGEWMGNICSPPLVGCPQLPGLSSPFTMPLS